MKQSLSRETYSIFSLEVDKSETRFKTVDEIIGYLKERIMAHEIARFITVFDHYAHTRSLEYGQISDEILDAKNIVLCFGITLPGPEVMAERPRSIGICELKGRFFITFMEAPMPVANSAMEEWVKSIPDQG
ncbi:MAG TPA: hypothetical protein ENI99_06045 [Sedimenticola sp.]|nr:hypothetical protein [Sedimenticola sp.]